MNGPIYGRCTGKRALATALPGNDAEPPSNLYFCRGVAVYPLGRTRPRVAGG